MDCEERHRRTGRGRTRYRAVLLALMALALLGSMVACRSPLGSRDGPGSPIAAPTEPGPSSATSSTASGASGTVLEAPAPPAPPAATGAQTLTLAGTPDGPATLDPALVRDVDSAFIVRQIFRGLVRLDDQLRAVPDLARRVEISPDGLSYTFHLYEDISFDDGRRVTADDVAYSLNRATDPALTGGNGALLPAQTYLSDIRGAADRMAGRAPSLEGVEVLDRATVRINLERRAENFLVKLAGTPGYVVDRRNVESGDDWWRKPNGSGPFALTEWRAGDRMVLSGHQGYRPHPPTLKTVTILEGAGALQPLNLYEQRQIDLANVPASSLDRIMAPNSPFRSQLVSKPLYSVTFALLNPHVAPLDDPTLRRALIESFDRSKVAHVSLGGHVRVAAGILPSGMLGRDWRADLPAYDLEAGRASLKQVDGGHAPALTIYTSGAAVPVTMKEVYERDLDLPVEVVQLRFADYLHDLGARTLPMMVVNWVADYPDPDTFLRALFYSTSPDNYIGYDNPEVDRLLDAAVVEPDPDRRAGLYARAQQRIIDDGVVIPLYEDVAYQLVSPALHGITVTPLGMLGLESVWATR